MFSLARIGLGPVRCSRVGLGSFSVRSRVGLGSVRSGSDLVFGLFGLAQCWPWVCSVWIRLTKYLNLGLFGLNPPVHDPSPSGPYLFGVGDLVLVFNSLKL